MFVMMVIMNLIKAGQPNCKHNADADEIDDEINLGAKFVLG